MFAIGQKVVCIDDRLRKGRRYYRGENLPKNGVVYTMRETVDARARVTRTKTGGSGWLKSRNRKRWYTPPTGRIFTEMFFSASRFRPLRSTNIDVFLKMLEPMPARERELVD
jgi:hypothetical protein